MTKAYNFLFFTIFFLFVLTPIYGESALDITEKDFIIGNEDAKITIIEYASLSCSHCADFHENTLETLKKEYIDTGKVKMVEILEGVMEAQNQFNIKSTPSFIINGKLVEGNKSIKEFRQIIDKILSQ